MRKKQINSEDLYPVGTRIIVTAREWPGLVGVVTDANEFTLKLTIQWNDGKVGCFEQRHLSSHTTEPPPRMTEAPAQEYHILMAAQGYLQ